MREWWSRLRGTFGVRPEDLREEVDVHLEMQIQDALDRGLSPEEVRRRFGNRTLIQERARDAWAIRSLDALLQDVRYGLRGICKTPGFSLVVMLTLALGIGANTAIFSVVNAVLLCAAPYPNSERLVWLGESTPRSPGISVTWLNYQQWRAANHTFQDLAIYEQMHLTLTGRDEPLLTRAALVSSNFFRLLGVQALMGRTFTAAEDQPGAARTVVLAHAFWSGRLGGDPNVLGTTLILNSRPYQVIGVAPPVLQFFTSPADYYLPIAVFEGAAAKRDEHGSMRVLGLLKPKVTLADATADLDRIMQHLEETDPGPESGHRAYGAFLGEHATREIRPTLLILMGAVGLVLILACANVASLVLARSTARLGEIAVRSAIGAGRMRLVRQLLTENLLTAACGGAGGLLLAALCVRALVSVGPRDIPRLAETRLNPEVLLFTAGITILTGLLVGLAPVFTVGRLDLSVALKDVSRTATAAGRGQALRSLLVVAEVAITLVLAFASGLLFRSLALAENASPGFAPDHLLALELVLPRPTYQTAEAIGNFFDRLSGSLRNLPGVTSVGSVFCPPAAGDCRDWFYSVLGQPIPAQGEVPVAYLNTADASYFATMRIPIREGRAFAATDSAAAPHIVIVNEAFARKWWPKETAVGHQIKMGGPYIDNGPPMEIVGVVGDVSQDGLDSEAGPEIFLPQTQDSPGAMVVMVRTAGDPGRLMASVRRRVFAIDRNLPIQSLRPFEQALAASLDRRRFTTLLLALFAGLAMVLAAVGVCGLLNYWVSVRESEIAIRMVLGAPRWNIMRWVGRQAMVLAAAGIAAGAAAAWAASRWLASLVFGVSARNPWALVAAGSAVITLALLAAAAPVWRATRVDAAGKVHQG